MMMFESKNKACCWQKTSRMSGRMFNLVSWSDGARVHVSPTKQSVSFLQEQNEKKYFVVDIFMYCTGWTDFSVIHEARLASSSNTISPQIGTRPHMALSPPWRTSSRTWSSLSCSSISALPTSLSSAWGQCRQLWCHRLTLPFFRPVPCLLETSTSLLSVSR